MIRLGEIGQRSRQLARGAPVLFQQLLGENRIGILDTDFVNEDGFVQDISSPCAGMRLENGLACNLTRRLGCA